VLKRSVNFNLRQENIIFFNLFFISQKRDVIIKKTPDSDFAPSVHTISIEKLHAGKVLSAMNDDVC